MWNTARGDADPVPERICLEIFETSSALARKRFRFGRDPQDTGAVLRDAHFYRRKSNESYQVTQATESPQLWSRDKFV